jgi:hypothetical protein
MKIEDLDISVRAYNCLQRARIKNTEDLQELTFDDLFSIRNLGRKCAEEVRDKLIENGFNLKDQVKQIPKYNIFVSEQQIKILNAVDRYMNKYPFAKEGGSEYVSQSDPPQIGAIDLACELADIYCEYR